MSDIEAYYTEDERRPELMDDSDLRDWHSDCLCLVCRRKGVGGKNITPLFGDYGDSTLHKDESLLDHQYMLCPVQIPAFVFRTRVWGRRAHNLLSFQEFYTDWNDRDVTRFQFFGPKV